MEFFSYHGCIREEAIIGTKFILNLEIQTDTSKAEETDNLKHTINYQEVYQLIREEMIIRSNLLEHVGRRVINKLLAKYPKIDRLKLKISKLNPPLGGSVEKVSLTLTGQNEK